MTGSGAAGEDPVAGLGGELDDLTYEQLLERLEGIVNRMAAGDIGIEQVADLYEQAGRLQAAAAERLERVRRRLDGLAEPPPAADPS